jgi:hypothetical protein
MQADKEKPNVSAEKKAAKQSTDSKKPRVRKKSTKGALIKGMSKHLPAELLNEPTFEEGLDQIMKGYSGVYALYKGKKLYYVGLAKNLRSRLNDHRKNKHARKWDNFVIFRIKQVNYLKDIETLLLRVGEPPGNSVSGHVPQDANLNRVLKRIQQEQERKLRRFKKALR